MTEEDLAKSGLETIHQYVDSLEFPIEFVESGAISYAWIESDKLMLVTRGRRLEKLRKYSKKLSEQFAAGVYIQIHDIMKAADERNGSKTKVIFFNDCSGVKAGLRMEKGFEPLTSSHIEEEKVQAAEQSLRERLNLVINYKIPWEFSTLANIAMKMIPTDMKEKIKLITKAEEVGVEMCPKSAGGTLDTIKFATTDECKPLAEYAKDSELIKPKNYKKLIEFLKKCNDQS